MSISLLGETGELNITSDEWQLIGTQIEAYRGYIQNKYLKSEPAKLSRTYEQKHESFDVEIPLAGNTGNGISGAFGRAEGHASLVMNARIHVHEHLQLEVSGTANMRGIHVSARSLEAFFDELLLESIQDIEHHSEYGAGLGLSSADISSVSGNVGKRNKHMVSEITALIGSEKATIVVANALRLNGAMIAAAHRAEDGSYSEHGLLTLRVGEFFVQHIHDYDEGYTLGGALGSDFLSPTFGGHRISGTTFGTVGRGSIECTKAGGTCETAFARRDVTKPQERTTEYDVRPITAYVPLGPMPSLPRTPDGQLDWRRMSDNLHAQTFGTIAALAKLVGKPFGVTDKAAKHNEAREQEFKKAKEKLKRIQAKLQKKYDQLSKQEQQSFESRSVEQEEILQNLILNFESLQNAPANSEDKSASNKNGVGTKILQSIADGLRKLADSVAASDDSPIKSIEMDFMELSLTVYKYGQAGARLGNVKPGIGNLIGALAGIGIALSGELIGRLWGKEIAEYSKQGKEKVYEFLREKFPALNQDDAKLIAAGTFLLLGSVTMTAIQMKGLMKDLRALSLATASATAGARRTFRGPSHADDALPDYMFMHDIALKPGNAAPASKVEVDVISTATPAKVVKESRKSIWSRIFGNDKIIDLGLHEKGDHKGHAIERHVGKYKKYFETRLANERMDAATSYPDIKIANQVTSEVLQRRIRAIEKWAKNAKISDREEFSLGLGREIGYGLKLGETVLTPRTKALVVLKKMPDYSIKIITSYPID